MSTGPEGGTSTQDHEGTDPRRWKALTVCLVAGFMTLLDVSIVNVALPSIRTGLDAPQSALQWVVSGYALTFGLVLVPAGRFGDMHGRRNAFVFGVALFTVASAAAGIAQNPTLLVIARLVQGVAGGVINPQVSGLIQQLFRGAERGRAFGMLGTVIGVSTAIGPLLGGMLINLGGDTDGLAPRLLRQPADRHPGRGRWRTATSGPPRGVLARGRAWTPWACCCSPPASSWCSCRSSRGRSGRPRRSGCSLLAGLVVLAVFAAWERRYGRRHQPVVDLSLFRRRSYALGALLGALYFAGFTAIFFILTLYLQNGLGYSALEAGLATTPFAAGRPSRPCSAAGWSPGWAVPWWWPGWCWSRSSSPSRRSP